MWLPARTAPQTGWFLASNWAMAKRDYVVIAKRDRRRKGTMFQTQAGGLVHAEIWAPIPPIPSAAKLPPKARTIHSTA